MTPKDLSQEPHLKNQKNFHVDDLRAETPPLLRRQHQFWARLFIIVAVIAVIYGGYRWMAHPTLIRKDTVDTFHQKPVVVQAATVYVGSVPIYVKALGNVTASTSVVIKTQVNGQLVKLHFKEGQDVVQGDLLAEIDDRALQAQVTQYEGQLLRDQALLENAELDLERAHKLEKKDFVTEQALNTQQELVKQYLGTVKSDQGMLENAKVNLSYCKITAPVSGRLGLQAVDVGNNIQTSDVNGIVTLNVFNPVFVTFAVAEDQLPAIMKQFAQQNAIQVEAFDRSQQQHLQTGQLLAIDNQIDPTTGMIKLKASFDNNPSTLFSGQFVNVKLLLQTLGDALIIPTAAIQYGVNGPYVYVIRDDNTVEIKTITTYTNLENEETVVTTGLTAGEQVVMEGTDKLKDGIQVIVHNTDHQSSRLKDGKLNKVHR